jgi:hypothetical protein
VDVRPVRAAAAAKPPIMKAAGVAPPPQRRANHMVALALIVGGLLLLLGGGTAVAVVCLAAPDRQVEEDKSAGHGQKLQAPRIPKVEIPGPANKQPAEPAPAPPQKVERNPEPAAKQAPPEKDVKPEAPPPPQKENPPGDEVKKPAPQAEGKSVVSAQQQKKIDEAIDRGVKYLNTNQQLDGSWPGAGNQALGTTALPALTLLECGTGPKDSRIAAAADFVRKEAGKNHKTYEISLAILFLDKLIEKKQADKKSAARDESITKDKQIIQALALRLIAGQTAKGGWDYDCPVLTTPDATSLMTSLKQNRPKAPPVAIDLGEKGTLPTPTEKNPVEKPKSNDGSNKVTPGGGMSWGEGTRLPLVAGPVPAALIADPLSMASQGQAKQKDAPKTKFRGDRDDNSNTQFAMMALWAARRHDVPVETALFTVEQRFRVSQLENGGWSYLFPPKGDREKASMTCVGLIGIALGKGTALEVTLRNNKHAAVPRKMPLDGQIRDGFKALEPHILPAKIENGAWPAGLSLYFMWSVERVAVLYDLRRIGEHDWYQWGCDILLDTQRPNGSWETHSYPGASATIDTCFALLFLKRVNLVQDLTDLQLYMAVPEAQPKK